MNKNDMKYIIGNNSSSGRLITVHTNNIEQREDLNNVRIPYIVYSNIRFMSLYPDSTRYKVVSLEEFKQMTDEEIGNYHWIFDTDFN